MASIACITPWGNTPLAAAAKTSSSCAGLVTPTTVLATRGFDITNLHMRTMPRSNIQQVRLGIPATTQAELTTLAANTHCQVAPDGKLRR